MGGSSAVAGGVEAGYQAAGKDGSRPRDDNGGASAAGQQLLGRRSVVKLVRVRWRDNSST